jgi:sugar lactone lactonase YvrE
MRRALVLTLALVSACTPLRMKDSGEIEAGIRQITQALTQQPDNAPLIYILATLHDRAGNANEVVYWFNILDQLGWDYGVSPHDFRKSTAANGYREIVDRLNAREPKVRNASVAFTIEGHRDLIPEGIAYDPVDDAFYLTSIYRRKVVRVDRNGAARDFVAEGADGMGSSLGVRIDAKRRVLWTVAGASEWMRGWSPSMRGQGALYGYDLRDGRLVTKIATGSAEQPAMLNDLAIAADGTIYITDMLAGRVVRVTPGSQSFETWTEGLQYPNGIAVSDDGRHVYVADFRGVTRVTTADKTTQRIEATRWLGGIDGLSWRNGTLIGIQNAAGKGRVIRIHLNEDNRVEILEAGNELFDLPTTGAVAGDAYFFIANPQIKSYDGSRLWPEERLKSPVMLRLPL